PEQCTLLTHRQAVEVGPFEERFDFGERRRPGDGERVVGHHVADLVLEKLVHRRPPRGSGSRGVRSPLPTGVAARGLPGARTARLAFLANIRRALKATRIRSLAKRRLHLSQRRDQVARARTRSRGTDVAPTSTMSVTTGDPWVGRPTW